MSTLPYRPDIQGLRAIAIVLVVLAHAGFTAFSGGFIGVDVFFVLSGYLITGLLINEHSCTGNIQLARFVARRLKRLLPTLLLMITLTTLASSLLISSYEFRSQISSAMYASTWTSNLFFAFTSFDYFSELQMRDLFLHTWSLGVEEQFYLVWPVFLLITLTLLTRLLGRNDHRAQLLLILSVMFIGSLGLSLYWTSTQPLWSFYLMPSRIWQFALGAIVFVWFDGHAQHKKGILEPRLSWALNLGSMISGLLLIIGSAVFMHPNMTYPGYWALLPSIGAALIIATGNQGGRTLSHPALVWIGDRSYSWYLWHWGVLMLGFSWGMQNRLVDTVFLIALSLLLAILSYRLVELPFWKGRLSQPSPARSILLSLLAMLVVVSGIMNYSNHIDLSDNERLAKIDNAARIDIPIIYSLGCDAWYYDANVLPCKMGEPIAGKTVVLLGDSIGAQWFSLLPEIFKTPEWRIEVLTKSSCAIVDEDYFYNRIGKIYSVCTEWRNAVLDYLSSLQPDIVIVGSSATYDFSKKQWIEGSIRVLSRLTEVADHVIILPGTPKLSFDGPGCLARSHAHTTQKDLAHEGYICREALSTTQASDVAHYLKKATQHFQKAKLLDLNDIVCPNGYCAAKNPSGLVVFRDQQHLTDSFVRAQVPSVIERLKILGLGPILTSLSYDN